MTETNYHLNIVASRTPSFLVQIIRLATKFKHNHVSISLNDDLVPLFSFARYNYNSPFHGGFVEESWLRYLYRDNDISVSIYSISITKKTSSREGYTCLTFVEKILKEIGVVEKNRVISSIQELEELLKEYYIEDRTICSKDKGLYFWWRDEYFIKR